MTLHKGLILLSLPYLVCHLPYLYHIWSVVLLETKIFEHTLTIFTDIQLHACEIY